MKAVDVKEIARRAFREGNLRGGDPFEAGRVPPDIEDSIDRAFEAWWRIEMPPTVGTRKGGR